MDLFFLSGPLLFLPLLAWFGSALLTSWLATELGRPGGVWVLVGLLLGPIALVAVGFAGRPQPARSS